MWTKQYVLCAIPLFDGEGRGGRGWVRSMSKGGGKGLGGVSYVCVEVGVGVTGTLGRKTCNRKGR